MRTFSEARTARSVLAGILGVCAGIGCGSSRVEVLQRDGAGFLQRRGPELYLDERPYRYLSFNAYTLTGCGEDGEVPNDQQLDEFFSSLRPRSLVRTYALEASGEANIERVVAAASARGHLLILVLAIDAGDCADGGIKKTNDWYASGFRESYLPWVQRIVPRFAGQRSVGMWELVKGPTQIDPATLRGFFDVVGGEVRRLDPNHLVASGSHGPWAYGSGDGADYATIHASPGIDVGGTHEYDNVADEPVNLRPALAAIAAVAKPLIIAEIGMFAGAEGDPAQTFGPQVCISWDARRAVFTRQMTAAFAQGAAGANVWAWFPNVTSGCSVRTHPGEPLVDLVREFAIP